MKKSDGKGPNPAAFTQGEGAQPFLQNLGKSFAKLHFAEGGDSAEGTTTCGFAVVARKSDTSACGFEVEVRNIGGDDRCHVFDALYALIFILSDTA